MTETIQGAGDWAGVGYRTVVANPADAGGFAVPQDKMHMVQNFRELKALYNGARLRPTRKAMAARQLFNILSPLDFPLGLPLRSWTESGLLDAASLIPPDVSDFSTYAVETDAGVGVHVLQSSPPLALCPGLRWAGPNAVTAFFPFVHVIHEDGREATAGYFSTVDAELNHLAPSCTWEIVRWEQPTLFALCADWFLQVVEENVAHNPAHRGSNKNGRASSGRDIVTVRLPKLARTDAGPNAGQGETTLKHQFMVAAHLATFHVGPGRAMTVRRLRRAHRKGPDGAPWKPRPVGVVKARRRQ